MGQNNGINNSSNVTERISPFDATGPNPNKVSERYKFVSTREAIDALEAQGFTGRPLLSRRAGPYGLHLVNFTHPMLKPVKLGQSHVTPRVILRNSHDGSAAFGLISGAFREACLNGLILGHGFAVRLVHTGDIQRDIKETLPQVFSTIQRGIKQIEAWSLVETSAEERISLASSALTLRISTETLVNVDVTATAHELLRSYRYEDNAQDLFTVYNRIQEKLVRGGVRTVFKEDSVRGRRIENRWRKLSGARSTLSVNQRLSDLIQAFYEIKTGVK